MVCAFTGHRPEHLPWRTDETDARCAALKAVLQREVSALYQRGFSAFLCGMARGCDLYFAEAVLALRDAGELPDANLTAMLPCPSQAARWDAKTLDRYRQILARCDEVRVLEAEYSPGCMLRRNRAIVRENLAVLDGWIAENPHFYYTKPQAGTTALVYYDFDVPSYEFCKRLYDETGAFVTPGDCFEQPKSMRIGYACDKKTLEDGLAALARFAETLG